jgi:molybdate transport system substrate-binding protein
VAVAGNFAAPFEVLAEQFTATSGVKVNVSIGSTGQFYAQIGNGAPFDVFLAADAARPERLETDGLTVPGTRFTYAVGRLAYYAPTRDSVRDAEFELLNHPVRHLAVANPQTAPYGAAAREVLTQWGLWDKLHPVMVRGANVAQTFQFVESGAAEAGFVALSQVIQKDEKRYWIVPASHHIPIQQDAVLLASGADNPGARRLLDFLRSDGAREVIASFGYGVRE